jgi:O-antigen ligase
MFSWNIGARDVLCVGIVLSIGFQQFPVLRLGGSFRVYELLAALLLLVILASGALFRLRELWSLSFFVVAPLISFLFFWASWVHDINGYYQAFGVAGQFRYGYFAATFVPLFYFFLCWVAFSSISNNTWLFVNRAALLRLLIIVGNGIGLFALIAAFLNGALSMQTPIQMLPDWLQNVGKASYGFRTSGFSQEPSFFVLYQGWVLLLTYFYRGLFSRLQAAYFIVVAAVCLLMTLSSALLGFAGACAIVAVLVGRRKTRLKRVGFLVIALGALCVSIYVGGYQDLFYYAFYKKIVGFFSLPSTTLDSGQFRAYTAALGYEIFKEYPITGVGPGASIFFMHAYEHAIPIATYGERLNPGSFPQNSYVSVLADLGLVGFVAMLGLLWYSLSATWRATRLNAEMVPFLIGLIFTMVSLLSIAPAYSMFIWVFPALSVCFARGVLSRTDPTG